MVSLPLSLHHVEIIFFLMTMYSAFAQSINYYHLNSLLLLKFYIRAMISLWYAC